MNDEAGNNINGNDAFKDLKEHDSMPTVPLTKLERIRCGEIAKALEDAKIQAYIEANFGIQALEAVKMIIPLLAGLL